MKTKKVVAVEPTQLTYAQILDRDVPVIIARSRSLASQGIVGTLDIYYKHRAILASSPLLVGDPTKDGWTPTGVSIPCNVPYSAYYNFLYQRLGNVPLFA
jgi:hypothetical protein